MTIKLPVVRGVQGSQIAVYQGHIIPSDIKAFLGHDPRSKHWGSLDVDTRSLYESIQRPTKAVRVKDLSEYIQSRILKRGVQVAAIPSLSIGVLSAPIFEPVEDSSTLGTLELVKGKRIAFDGLGRLTSILDLCELGAADGKIQFEVPISVFAPARGNLTHQALAQLFYDFNVMRAPVTAIQARGKDSASPHAQVARGIMRMPIFAAMPEKQRTSFDIEKALRFVRAAVENVHVNYSITKRVVSPIITGANWAKFVECFEVFWTEVAKNVTVFGSRDSVMFFQHGYSAIATTLFKYTKGRMDAMQRNEIQELARAIASIDWNKTNPDWNGRMLGELGNGKTVTLGGAGHLSSEEYVIEKASSYLASIKTPISATV